MKNSIYKKSGFIKMKLVFYVLACFITNMAVAQTDVPKIIKPAPETASLFKFQDYPVDYFTGLPQISISLYEVKSSEITVPISISYHASGRKVYDQDGPIALEWSLDAGGMIARTIYGSVDFGTGGHGTYKFPYPFNLTNISNYNDYAYLERLFHFDKNPEDALPGTWMDSEYDIFSYYFGNKSGKFIFRDSDNVKIPTLLPFKPYVITPAYTQNGLTKIDIVDDKGTLYKFIGSETFFNSSSNDQAISGYELSQIISGDKTDTVTFLYDGLIETKTTISQQVIINDKSTIVQSPNDPIYVSQRVDNEITNHDQYQISRLKEIDFKYGKVLFNLDQDSKEVNDIEIMNNNNEVIKKIKFYKSYMDNLSEIGFATHKLDSIVFYGEGGTQNQAYSFDYYPTVNANPTFNVRYRDWWGYYNASGVHDMVPYYTNLEYVADNGVNIEYDYTAGYADANRDPNLLGLESGILKKITFPTGGSTKFIYENNKYYSYAISQVKNGPGMRISQIITDDNNGGIKYKTFKYGIGESGYGFIDMEPDISNMASELHYNYYYTYGQTNPQTQGHYRQRIFSSDFIPELNAIAERPVIYTEVTEYDGTVTDNIGKTIYDYDYSGWAPSGMPAFESLTIPRKHIYDYNYWNKPSLLKQTDYENIAAGSNPEYKAIREILNYYNIITTKTVKGLHVQHIHIFPQDGKVAGSDLYPEPYGITSTNPQINSYTYSEYQIPVGYKNLTNSTETIFNDDNSQIVSSTAYSYNSRQLINQTSKTISDGSTITNTVKYPFDYTGNNVLSEMVDANMLDFPIEQSENNNGDLIKSIKTNYIDWGASTQMIQPQTVEVKKGEHPYEIRLRYLGYDDYANLLSVSKENDQPHTYIWDYNHGYPIAEVVNAQSNQIAYTSFESDGSGYWSIPTGGVVSSDAITGNKCYNLANAASTGITKSGLDASKNYILSYWTKNTSAYTVIGTQGAVIKGKTVNGWTYFEHSLTGVSSAKISGSGYIDELRLYPSNAEMTTYTYSPLVGMTSKCDVNNTIQYFDYDGLNRLNSILDQDLNVIKTVNYHSVQ